MIYLNIGSGNIKKNGYMNIDLYNKQADINADMADTGYGENSVDRIYCSHLIEHVSADHFKQALIHWHRILKKDGELEILCPNAIVYLKELIDNMENESVLSDWRIRNVLGWENKGIGMYNRNLVSLNTLRIYLISTDFKIIKLQEQPTRTKKIDHPEYRKNGDLYCLAQAEK